MRNLMLSFLVFIIVFGAFTAVHIFASMKILRLFTYCDELKDGVCRSYLVKGKIYGHGIYSLVNGAGGSFLNCFICIVSIVLCFIIFKDAELKVLCSVGFSFCVSLSAMISELYMVTEIKHVNDKYMTNKNFFEVYGRMGLWSFVSSMILFVTCLLILLINVDVNILLASGLTIGCSIFLGQFFLIYLTLGDFSPPHWWKFDKGEAKRGIHLIRAYFVNRNLTKTRAGETNKYLF